MRLDLSGDQPGGKMERVAIWLETIDQGLNWVPSWAVSLALFALAVLLAYWAHALAFRILTRIVSGMDLFWRSLVSRTEGPTRLAATTVALGFAAKHRPSQSARKRHRPARPAAVLHRAHRLACQHHAAHLGHGLSAALQAGRRGQSAGAQACHPDPHPAPRRGIIIFTLALGAALMSFEGVRQIWREPPGVGGRRGPCHGSALQPVLKNLFAGIQLAVTQPIRIEMRCWWKANGAG